MNNSEQLETRIEQKAPEAIIFRKEGVLIKFLKENGKWFEKTSWNDGEEIKEIGEVELVHILRDYCEENETEINFLNKRTQELQVEIQQANAVIESIKKD